MNKTRILDTYAKFLPTMQSLGDLLRKRDKNHTKLNGCKIQLTGIPDDFRIYLDGHRVCDYAFKCIYQINVQLFNRVFAHGN